MTLAERKSAELARKLASLDEEFKRWEQASAQGGPLQKHHTQIRGVLLPLRALRDRIEADLKGKSGEALLAEARKATQLILGIHRIWEFFRPKLAQRADDRFRDFLEIADEFAWLCYEPVVKKTAFRRPPLIFLNGGASPFILRRNDRFEAEATSSGTVDDQDFEKVLAQLPFPVVGVPWHQLEYWPEMVVIGHEVGHSVERDLNLSDELDIAIDLALKSLGDTSRNRYWKAWRSELCADAYGCLATGPAYVSALADFLANSHAVLASASPSAKSDYPPTLLRVAFNQEVLEACKLDATVHGWDFATPATLSDFLPEAKAVARAFVTKGGPLHGLLSFTAKQWQDACTRAQNAIARHQAQRIVDLRVLIAAIRCAFESSPTGWDQRDVKRKLDQSPLDQLRAEIKPLVKIETRSGAKRRSAEQDRVDKGSAAILYDLLLKPGLEFPDETASLTSTRSGGAQAGALRGAVRKKSVRR